MGEPLSQSAPEYAVSCAPYVLAAAPHSPFAAGCVRVAVQLKTEVPPLAPKQPHVVDWPIAGNAGISGLGVPVLQSAPEKLESVDEYVVAALPHEPFTNTPRVAVQFESVPPVEPWHCQVAVAP